MPASSPSPRPTSEPAPESPPKPASGSGSESSPKSTSGTRTRSAKTRGRRGRPVSERRRLGRLWGGLIDYALIGWWGIVRPRVREKRRLEISQAVVLREGSGTADPEVLLSIRSDLFGWELPGGTVERGETPEEALVREVWEETGFEVEIEAHVGDWIREGFRPHIAHVYRCRVLRGTLTPSSETPRVAWCDAKAPPRELFPWYEAPLSTALLPHHEEIEPATHRDWQGLRTILTAVRIDLGIRWQGLPEPADAPIEAKTRDRASVNRGQPRK